MIVISIDTKINTTVVIHIQKILLALTGLNRYASKKRISKTRMATTYSET
jgi:hypothetical protein